MKKLRVGFDLDGVLLYNPARIVRMPVTRFKHYFFPKREKVFYVPSTEGEKILWRIFHWSSLFVAPGLSDVKELEKKGLIEPYIITARYDFLKNDVQRWLKFMNANSFFKGAYMNQNNLQPHAFKEQMVHKLDLDIFIEDNWDVVEHLTKKTNVKAYWIYNIFDRNIPHAYKFPSLQMAVDELASRLLNSTSRKAPVK